MDRVSGTNTRDVAAFSAPTWRVPRRGGTRAIASNKEEGVLRDRSACALVEVGPGTRQVQDGRDGRGERVQPQADLAPARGGCGL